MKLTKNGVVVVINDKAHIDAYLSSGWKPINETAPVNSTLQKHVIKPQK